MPKIRLDVLLLERGLAESRAKAQALIMAGQVRVNDQVVLKPATAIDPGSTLTVDSGPRFVSRGGEKLDAALQAFTMDISGLVCADVGASTGGFTDCMLQHGAAKVYAIDVGKGILHWKLRNDPRVVVMEETNARFVGSLPEQVSLVTVDASFISLKILLPVLKTWLKEGAQLICLIKPQFEAGRKDVSRGDGVIRDPEIHRQVLSDLLGYAKNAGFGLRGLIRSPLMGPKGNREFLVWLAINGDGKSVEELVYNTMKEESAHLRASNGEYNTPALAGGARERTSSPSVASDEPQTASAAQASDGASPASHIVPAEAPREVPAEGPLRGMGEGEGE